MPNMMYLNPEDERDAEIRKLLDEGLKPITICAILDVEMQRIYDIIDEDVDYDDDDIEYIPYTEE